MKNSSKEMTVYNIYGGAMITDEHKNIDIPPKKSIEMNIQDMFSKGEISITLEEFTAIREDGVTKARIGKYSNVLTSAQIDEKEAQKAVKEYMAKQKEGMEI